MSLYETDFFAWTQDQAGRLKKLAATRPNVGAGVDWTQVAEEIEDMGNDTLAKIEGLVAQIVAHLLKLEHCPGELPRAHWRGEVTAWRNTVRRRAKRSPTALDRIDVAELVDDAVAELRAQYKGQPWVQSLPVESAYRIDQVLDRDWFPESRHGIAD